MVPSASHNCGSVSPIGWIASGWIGQSALLYSNTVTKNHGRALYKIKPAVKFCIDITINPGPGNVIAIDILYYYYLQHKAQACTAAVFPLNLAVLRQRGPKWMQSVI